jgi:hypothetical protein
MMSYLTIRKAQHQQGLEVEIMHWTDDGTGTVKSRHCACLASPGRFYLSLHKMLITLVALLECTTSTHKVNDLVHVSFA